MSQSGPRRCHTGSSNWLRIIHVDFPAAPAPCPPGHRRRRPLSRYQDPRPPSYPPPRSPLAWRHSGWRLDRQANPPHRSHQLPPLRRCLRPEPAALRSPEAQRPRPATARRLPLRLPPHAKRSPSSPALPLFPQTPVRTSRQQPLPSPPRYHSPASEQTRSRLPPRRQRHSTNRRSPGRLTPRDVRLFCSTLWVANSWLISATSQAITFHLLVNSLSLTSTTNFPFSAEAHSSFTR